MAISVAETLQMECGTCGAAFPAAAWILVDAQERPDLWLLCHDGTIRTIRCPNGHATDLGMPLLLHDGAHRAAFFLPYSPSLGRYPTKQDIEGLGNEISQPLFTLLRRLDAALPATASRDYLRLVRIVAWEELEKVLADLATDTWAPSERLVENASLVERIDGPWEKREMPARIALIRSALAETDRAQEPLWWGFLQWRLGTSLAKAVGGDRDANVEQAITAFDAGLTVYTRDRQPEVFASLQINLSTMYLRRNVGSTEVNLRAAIEAAEAALTWYTEQRDREWWQLATENLEEAQRRLALELEHPGLLDVVRERFGQGRGSRQPSSPRNQRPTGRLGDIFDQLSESAAEGDRIPLIEEALGLVDPAVKPALWATLQLGLAEYVLNERAAGDDAAFARAVAAYRAGLAAVDPRAQPQEWAALLLNLGSAYFNRSDGDREQSLALAIEAYREGLLVPQRDETKKRRAELQYNLGLALLELRTGDPDENLRQAVSALREAQTVLTLRSYPKHWAEIQVQIGRGYKETLVSDPAQAIEEAIAAFEEALRVFTRQHLPLDWARVQAHLGFLYGHRLKVRVGEAPDHYERAIDAYQKALSVFSREQHPERWAAIQFQLAWPYRFRIVGDPADNHERALESLRNALTIYTPDGDLDRWADAQINLGVVLTERRYGDPAANMALAIRAFEAAQTVFTQEADPLRWADAEAEIGLVHQLRNKATDEASAFLERAIAVYESHRAVLNSAGLINLASIKLNLGQLYINKEDTERAIEVLESALSTLPRDHYPGRWAIANTQVARAYLHRVRGEPTENLQQVVIHSRAALEVQPPDSEGMESLLAVECFAMAQARLGRWDEVSAILEVALKATERMYTASLTEATRAEAIERNDGLYRLMVEACLRLQPPRPRDAFLYAEEGRSRLLRDQLGTLALPAPKGVPDSILVMEQDLLRQLRGTQGPLARTLDGPDLRTDLEALADTRERLAAIWNTMRQRYFADEYVALRRGEGVAWADVIGWLAEQPKAVGVLAFYTLTTDSLVAFIIRRGDSDPVTRTLAVPADLLIASAQRFADQVGARSSANESAAADRKHSARQSGTLTPSPDGPALNDGRLAQDLAHALLGSVMPLLAGVEILYVIPHGLLHHLPLHALIVNGRPLIEHLPLAYAPSVAVAMRVSSHGDFRAATRDAAGPPLVVGNPTGDLPFAEQEAVDVGRRLGVSPLVREQATKNLVGQALAAAPRAHLATHASFSPDDPFASGLALANGTLTAREMAAGMSTSELIVLSACQTGVHDVRTGDELVGLARALLFAGASTLVLSLWRVDDPVTKELMLRFYDQLYDPRGRKRMSVAEALRAAICATRRDFPDLYYWGPFVTFGDWQ